MKEIGGYFELDLRQDGICPVDGVRLNSGRNAFRYIIRACGIKKVHLPYFTCHTVWEAAAAEGCQTVGYELDLNLRPKTEFGVDDYIVYNNYFGVMGAFCDEMSARYKNVIIDNCQALYAKPRGLASFYSPRKFMGLPDGGIAVVSSGCEVRIDEQEYSVERMKHLLIRIDANASAGYHECKKAALKGLPIRKMSKLTEALLANFAYENARVRRLKNFEFLKNELGAVLDVRSEDDVPMFCSYKTTMPGLREKLIANRIYIAKYWPNVRANAELVEGFVHLPIDQRYNIEDMKRILEVIRG